MRRGKRTSTRKEVPTSLPAIQPKVAGIDVGSSEHWVRGPARDDGKPNVRVFGTTTGSPEATERFFCDVARVLHRRVQLLTSLPVEKLSRLKVEKLTRDIGKDDAVKVEEAAGDEPKERVGR